MSDYYPFSVEPLSYPYDALEPYIDEKTMHFHHDKHYQSYVDKLNNILTDNPYLQKYSLENLIMNAAYMPADISTKIKNNAGGVYNHKLYFSSLTPKKNIPSPALTHKINQSFGTFDNFKSLMKEASLSQFGSGYAWLVSLNNGCLKILKSSNQDTPAFNCYNILLPIDVWEHAYYLKYQNRRDEYFENWFKIIGWTQVENKL